MLKQLALPQSHVHKDPEPQVIVHMLVDSSVNLQLRAWCPTDKYWETYWAVQKQVKTNIEAAGLTIPFQQQDLNINYKD